MTHQVQDVAAQAVEALIAPAQSAASAGRGLLSSLWSGIGGLQEGIARSITPPGREGQQPQPQVSGPMPVTYGSIASSTPPGRDGQVPTVEITQVPRSQVHQAPHVSGSGAQDSSTSGGAAASAVPGPGGSALPNLGNPVLDCFGYGYASATDFASEPAE